LITLDCYQQLCVPSNDAWVMVETAEAADHEVLEELQRGYKLKDRLVRPAMVKVAKNPGK